MYEKKGKKPAKNPVRAGSKPAHEKSDGSKPASNQRVLTSLEELGEFGLINRLTERFNPVSPSTIKGVGDDAAVIDFSMGSATVTIGASSDSTVCLVSTDLMVEGIHFDMTYTPLRHLGYKSVAINASDIAAMNGTPRQITVSMAISSRYTAEALEEIYEGIRLACQKYQIDLVGGDTSSSISGLVISVTVIGSAKKQDVVYRSGAKPGDLICVTGDLGSAYIGLLLLEREKKVFQANPVMQPELTGFDYQIGRMLKPEARTDITLLLEGIGVQPTSMIDISDGLASEALHLCKSSDTGCRIYEDKIPIDPQTKEIAMEFKLIPSVAALSGGEDYELLFTIKQVDYEKIKEVAGITVIGHMTDRAEGKMMVTPDGKEVEITAQGWKAF
ncbi:MAG: thiamine-phosphate kinase [Bacteroidales bacterium]|nr:thiamine-phosphate kinase [Bacteroidales bacterium]